MKEKVRKSMITKICDLLSCFIIVIIMVAGSCLYLPKCLGYKTYCVLGTSMEREIPLGSLVYMKEVPKEMIKEGDVIVFKKNRKEKEEEGVIRKVVEFNQKKGGYVTKAEQSQYADASIVKYEDIVGKVKKVLPFGGFVILFFQTKCGFIGAVGIVVLLIVLQLLGDIFDEREKRQKFQKMDKNLEL